MHLNGNRGQFLLSFGVIYLAVGIVYALRPSPTVVAAMAWMPAVSTVQICGIAWALSGLAAMVFAFTPMPIDRFGFMALSTWSAAWAISQTLGHSQRGYVSAMIYCLLARVVMIVAGMRNPVPKTTSR